jgi:hypothetical protein
LFRTEKVDTTIPETMSLFRDESISRVMPCSQRPAAGPRAPRDPPRSVVKTSISRAIKR